MFKDLIILLVTITIGSVQAGQIEENISSTNTVDGFVTQISSAFLNLVALKKQFDNPPIPDNYPNYVILKFRDDVPVRALTENTNPKILQQLNIREFAPLRVRKARGSSLSSEFFYLPHLTKNPMERPIKPITADTNTINLDIARIRARLKESDVASTSSLFQQHLSTTRELRAKSGQDGMPKLPDLENFYRIEMKSGHSPYNLIESLNAFDIVETAYLAPIPQNADIPPITPNLRSDQGYLNPAPIGISAEAAWNQDGGRGSRVTIIDIEGGWNTNHEDLNRPVYSSGINLSNLLAVNHGTAVLGIMVARNDGAGITGISANANYGTASAVRSVVAWWSVAGAVIDSVDQLDAGDIIVIEQHAPDFTTFSNSDDGTPCSCNCKQHRFLPMEYFAAEFAAIRYAVARGITVVEAAGNGSQNLDHDNFSSRFQRSFRDSGAILVGANEGNGVLSPACLSNTGSRVDVQAWGQNVATLDYGDGDGLTGGDGRFGGDSDDRQWYTGVFEGTSAATPIVAGAVASLQGIKLARDNVSLSPSAMRSLIVTTGTPQTSGANIGPQPNLATAVTTLLGQPPQTPTIGNSCTTPAAISDECGGNSCVEQIAGYESLGASGHSECMLWIFFCTEHEGASRVIYENVCMAP